MYAGAQEDMTCKNWASLVKELLRRLGFCDVCKHRLNDYYLRIPECFYVE